MLAVSAWLALTLVSGSLGPVSVITVQGRSMLGALEPGDLVLTGRQAEYRVGDVIVFRSQNLSGAVVIHRIIDIADGRFVTKGDNNGFVDNYRPLPSDVIGAQRLRVPGGGRATSLVDSPVGYALLATTAGVALLLPPPPRRRRAVG
jgi:signal peptidase I